MQLSTAPAITIDVDSTGFAMSTRPFTVTARELRAISGARSVDATDVRVTADPRLLREREVGWAAGRIRIGGAVLTEPQGTIARDRTIAWRARELAVRNVTVRAPSGTVTDAGVRWRADELVAGDASVRSLAGTIARDGTIEWLADHARWREATARALAGRIATSGDVEVHAELVRWRDAEMSGPTVTLSNGVVMWSARSVTRGSLALDDIAGTSTLDAGTHLVSWATARAGKLAFGAGIFNLASKGDRISITRGSVTAYGGLITLARTTPLESALVLDVRGVRLAAILGAFSDRAGGTGSLDGSMVVRDGEIERIDLSSRARGTFQVGDRSWVDQAVASLAAGAVGVRERIGGALADFAFTRLAVVLASSTNGPTLRVTVHGTGRRVPQELDLVVNVRGLREAAQVIARAREAS
jgi:hypothetical protein